MGKGKVGRSFPTAAGPWTQQNSMQPVWPSGWHRHCGSVGERSRAVTAAPSRWRAHRLRSNQPATNRPIALGTLPQADSHLLIGHRVLPPITRTRHPGDPHSPLWEEDRTRCSLGGGGTAGLAARSTNAYRRSSGLLPRGLRVADRPSPGHVLSRSMPVRVGEPVARIVPRLAPSTRRKGCGVGIGVLDLRRAPTHLWPGHRWTQPPAPLPTPGLGSRCGHQRSSSGASKGRWRRQTLWNGSLTAPEARYEIEHQPAQAVGV